MSDAPPDPDALPPALRRVGAPAALRGAPRQGAVPRTEQVLPTAASLARNGQIERTRGRLAFAAAGFALVFGVLALRLADATVIDPRAPSRLPPVVQARARDGGEAARMVRAPIVDRNGEVLAMSLPTSILVADPRHLIDPEDVARQLVAAIPRLDQATMARRLAAERASVRLAHNLTPAEQVAVERLQLPGIQFEPSSRRRYPMGRTAAHVVGGTDVDGHGVAGVERFFDARLREDGTPLRLSLDVRVQAAVREALERAIADFRAIGGAGVVMDVRSGEVLAMVSLPDFEAAGIGTATTEQRFNRVTLGVYEPGSTFKLLTAAMALEAGVVQPWGGFDASRPIQIGRFTINDFRGGERRWLALPEIMVHSSNIASAHMAAAVGAQRQRAFLDRMGLLARAGIELPESAVPLAPPVANWRDIATMTIGFGHGVSVSPLHLTMALSALVNGGTLMRPTLVAPEPGAAPRTGTRVVAPQTSDLIRRFMRLVVTEGTARQSDVAGYFVGGKTGTAEKTRGRGYSRNANIAAFLGAFPMHAPRYAVYIMVDEPRPNARSHGFATGGWVAAPAFAETVRRIGPILGVMPETERAAAIAAQLTMPLRPSRPAAAPSRAAPASTRRPPAPAVQPAVPPPPVRREARLAVEQ